MQIEVKITTKYAKILKDTGQLKKVLTNAVSEVAEKARRMYQDEMPSLTGLGKESVREQRISDLERLVGATRTQNGRPYLIYLHQGTGRLAGARDYGYTPGRVRTNDIARGIGGIRPNKFATRAYERLQKERVGEYILKNKIDKLIS